MILIVTIGFILLMFSLPISFVLGFMGILLVLNGDSVPLVTVPQRVFAGIDQFPLMAIPFFILAGGLMNEGGITQKLINLSQALIGRFRGALAQVNILVSIFFAGITGSAAADSAAIGSILIPAMEKDGYEKDFSAAVTSCSSLIGPIIPPSIPAVVYGIMANVSIGKLFLAGFLPGLMLGLAQMLVVYFYSLKRNYPSRVPVSFHQKLLILKDTFWALIMPLIIIIGIISGIFTPTEASSVAVVYAFFVGYFIYHNLNLEKISRVLLNSGITTGVVMLICGVSRLVSWCLAIELVPQRLTLALLSITNNPYVFLLLINMLLLIVGMFLETTSALIMLVPILAPIAMKFGIDPVHFGAIVVLNLTIGLATPPLGTSMFIVAGIAQIPVLKVARASIPFLIVSILILLFLTFCPFLAEWPALIFNL